MTSTFLVFVMVLAQCICLDLYMKKVNGQSQNTQEIQVFSLSKFEGLRDCRPQGSDEEVNECLKLLLQDIRPFFGVGLPQIGLPPLEPLRLADVSINVLGVRLTMSNIAVHGFSRFSTLQIKFNSNKRAKTFKTHYAHKYLRMAHHCNMSGHVFGSPAHWAGNVDIHIYNYWANATTNVDAVRKRSPENGSTSTTTRWNITDHSHHHDGMDRIVFDAPFLEQSVLGRRFISYLNKNTILLYETLVRSYFQQRLHKYVTVNLNKRLAQPPASPTSATPTITLPAVTTRLPSQPPKPTPTESLQSLPCPALDLTEKEKEGIRFECIPPHTPTPGQSLPPKSDDCSKSPQPVGSKLVQTCLKGYKTTGRASFSERLCRPNGTWQRGAHFSCIVECGLPKADLTGHIVNGTEAEPSNWPWNAAIFKRKGVDSDLRYEYLCGATLITSGALLTAAHCLLGLGQPSDFRIVLAPVSSKYSTNANYPFSQIMEIGQIHIHEQYNPATFEADIAVIKTAQIVQISSHVYPACFPFPGRENEQIERYQTSPGGIGIVAGFGVDESSKVSEKLKQVKLPVVTVRDCFRVLDVFPLTTQICAGYTTGISVCNGDSGAGYVFQEEGARKLYFLQGIVSHGRQTGANGRLCDHDRYSIFTKVGAFKEWVEQVVHSEE